MNIYFNNFVTDFPSFLFEFNQKREKGKSRKTIGIFLFNSFEFKQTNEKPNKKLFKGSFFIFQNNFFLGLFVTSFDLRKKTDKK